MKMIASIAAALALTGCASYGEYYSSIDAANAKQIEAAKAQAQSDAVRYGALMRIAESGDATAKVAAAMAIAFSQMQQAPTRMAVPAQPQNEALQWASIVAPAVMHGLSVKYNTRLAVRQSNNATRLGISTNQVFGQFASEINNPVVVTQPDPVIVTQPPPVIVTAPDPVIVDPVIVNPVVMP